MASTFDSIATTTLGSSTNLITFTSIPSTYTDLFIVIGSTQASSNFDSVAMYFNNDTASNYGLQGYGADGSSNGGSGGINPYASTTVAGNAAWTFAAPNSGSGRGQAIIYISRYADTTINKTSIVRWGAGQMYTETLNHIWYSTSAINRIDFKVMTTETLSAGTVFSIYGIKAA